MDGKRIQSKRVDGDKGDLKRKHKRHETYATYIYKVLRSEGIRNEVEVDLGISNKGMEVMNSLVNDLFERIASEASNLAKISKRNTIGKKDIESAAKLVIPGEIGRLIRDEADKALSKFTTSKETTKK
ncbi:Histone H2B [Giardia muris]|uniref:Histone H2B n=1 Tax=Giardia muris TaxID=5742 RepID=A0A4Z1SX12_GIAMU|nr:Histone H2B [Giardia muris]TNJ26253.1 Histone H2B [Giardia muris]|eukprot:TNJ26216.1 Histone H2B [Giardia muris]